MTTTEQKKELIKVQLPDWTTGPRTVTKDQYVRAKLTQLKEFGYTSLTYDDTMAQLEIVLTGATTKDGKAVPGLSIIGMFMRDEVKGKA